MLPPGVGARYLPLWPAGHLPHKGGELLGASFCPKHARMTFSDLTDRDDGSKVVQRVFSPLVGEMAGRPEGV